MRKYLATPVIGAMLLLSGCGSSSAPPAPTAGTSLLSGDAGPSWQLPGLTAALVVNRQDFVDGFQRSGLAQIGGGSLARSSDPSKPDHLDQPVLLTVDGVSPSAHVRFFSDVFLGPLEYEPAADSGLARLAKPSTNFVKNYCLPAKGAGRCAQIGRATGIVAMLTPDSIRSTTRGFKRATDKDFNHGYGGAVAIRPPGYQSGKGTTQAGHQLGYELGGPVKDPRNFVTQYNLANAPAQSTLENEVKAELSPSGAPASTLYVYLRVTPEYQGSCVIPYAVRYEAIGPNGWQLPANATGVAAQWLKFERDADGTTVAIIRNAERSGNQWLVPGQDSGATCVPPGYAG
jgi:hypothetical protein